MSWYRLTSHKCVNAGTQGKQRKICNPCLKAGGMTNGNVKLQAATLLGRRDKSLVRRHGVLVQPAVALKAPTPGCRAQSALGPRGPRWPNIASSLSSRKLASLLRFPLRFESHSVMSGVAFAGFGETQSPLSEGAPLPVAKIDESFLMGLASAEGIGKDLAKGFLLALEVDPESFHKAKSWGLGYLDARDALAGREARQGDPLRGATQIAHGSMKTCQLPRL